MTFATHQIGVLYLDVIDIGGSMFIHTFGAYFGLAVAVVLGNNASPLPPSDQSNHNESTKTSDTVFSFLALLLGALSARLTMTYP